MENGIVHELLDVEVEHLQRCYQHLFDQSPHHVREATSNNQCSNKSNITKGNEVIESNLQNSKLNKFTPPLNKVPSCEEQLTEIRKKYQVSYSTFTKTKQVLPSHPFPKGTCLIVWRLNIDYWLQKLPDYIIWNMGTMQWNNTSREILDKILKLKTYIQKELPKCEVTISTLIKRQDYGKAWFTISHLSKKFKDLNISAVDNSNVETFYLSSGGLHLNAESLWRLAINLKLRKLWCELDLGNDDYDKKMLEENTHNLQSQNNLTYDLSILYKVTTEEEDIKSSLGSLKLRNLNCLIFGQININSIRKKFELIFFLVWFQIILMCY